MITNFTGDNHNNNLWLIAIGFFSHLIDKAVPTDLAVIIQILGMTASILAIVNYICIFIERYKKWKKKK
jgi:threonine/homoserine/homoserine lactone efflux protein